MNSAKLNLARTYIRRKLRQRENRRSHREMLEYVAVLERRLRQTNPMDGLTCRRIAKEIHDMRAVLSGLGEMA